MTEPTKTVLEMLTAPAQQLPTLLAAATDDDLAAALGQEAGMDNREKVLQALDEEITRRKAGAGDGTGGTKQEHTDRIAPALARDEAAIAADARAREAGFVDARAQAEHAASPAKPAKRKATKPKKAAAVSIDFDTPIHERAAGRTLHVLFGDDKAGHPDIPPELVSEAVNRKGRLAIAHRVVPRADKIDGTVTVTHAWLMDYNGQAISRLELAAPLTIGAGQQAEFDAHSLAFG
jgi:hypothetical protein